MIAVAKVGLMFGGGGAKGSYQLGFIKAFFEHNLMNSFTHISGTSIGAINTLLLMTKKNYEDIKNIWDVIDSSNVFKNRRSIFSKDKGIFDLNPLSEVLFNEVSENEIKKSKYQGYATAAKMYSKSMMYHQLKTDTMERKVFHLNKVKEPREAVMASSSIPIIFGPTEVMGEKYVDGGMLDNYPLNPLLDAGCDIILAVPLDTRFKPYLYDNLDINIINFTSPEAFNKNLLIDALETLKFGSGFKEEKEVLGYFTANLIIDKLIKLDILQKRKFIKQEGFKVIELNKDDQLLIKNDKI